MCSSILIADHKFFWVIPEVPVCVQVIEKLAILMYSICAAKDSVLSCYKDT